MLDFLLFYDITQNIEKRRDTVSSVTSEKEKKRRKERMHENVTNVLDNDIHKTRSLVFPMMDDPKLTVDPTVASLVFLSVADCRTKRARLLSPIATDRPTE